MERKHQKVGIPGNQLANPNNFEIVLLKSIAIVTIRRFMTNAVRKKKSYARSRSRAPALTKNRRGGMKGGQAEHLR